MTQDDFLGGRISVLQPKSGYRAATDPVLLAAACTAKTGDKVLDLGCGVGVAGLCLAARVPDVQVTGVELQADYAHLGRRNASLTGLPMQVFEADLADLPHELRDSSFDHVIANPPFFLNGTTAPDPGRATARHEETPLAEWIATAGKRLRPKGWLTVILPASRLPNLLEDLAPRFGSTEVLPLAARPGRDADRIIVRSRKGGKGAFRLLATLILHHGNEHGSDGDDYSDKATAILRHGSAIDWS